MKGFTIILASFGRCQAVPEHRSLLPVLPMICRSICRNL
jgi:hypothetical protein